MYTEMQNPKFEHLTSGAKRCREREGEARQGGARQVGALPGEAEQVVSLVERHRVVRLRNDFPIRFPDGENKRLGRILERTGALNVM